LPTGSTDPVAPAAPELREVPLDEAMSIAILFQRHGQLADAEDVYRKILELIPGHPDALHFSGVLAHQQGRSDEGRALIERSLALHPDQPDCYSNLGIIAKAQGRLADAAAAYRKAIELNPDHANAHSNLGVLLRAEGQLAAAETEYREAIRLDPQHIDAHHNLGLLLASVKRTKEAVECFCRVTTLSPRHPEARRLLAMAHCTLGETEKAVEIIQEWLAEDPENPIAQHSLASASGRNVPARASDAYVETVFDSFASSFDVKLAGLSYRAPQIVGALVADAGVAADRSLDVLDAGCGTGLCGPILAPAARRLVGVDLSGRMLDLARERQVYDELVKGELTAFLEANPGAFDLIVSADTLVYFGPLDRLATAAARALRPRGRLIFTIEEFQAAGAPAGYRLQPHGRYCHARDYVQRTLEAAGFRVSTVRAELRMEAGVPVAGLAVTATVMES
jgi:predicted TPR repeat methyltransferase